MGMFRDMKDMVGTLRSDDLKELKRKADAQPKVSMREGVKLANQAVDSAQVWQQQAAQMPGFDPTGGAASTRTVRFDDRARRLGASSGDYERHLVAHAPAPVLARLDRAQDRMVVGVRVLRGMPAR